MVTGFVVLDVVTSWLVTVVLAVVVTGMPLVLASDVLDFFVVLRVVVNLCLILDVVTQGVVLAVTVVIVVVLVCAFFALSVLISVLLICIQKAHTKQ